MQETPVFPSRLCHKPRRELIVAFVSALLFGLAAHGYGFVNLFNNLDQVRNVYAWPSGLPSGRWLLYGVLEIGSRIDMPWFNGLMMLGFLALAAALVTDLLRLKNPVVIALCSLVLVTFPTIPDGFTYSHIADAYGVSIFLCALAVWCMDRGAWGFLPGAALLTLSMGIYQAYLCTAVALLGLRGLQLLLLSQSKDKALIQKMLRYAAGLLLALVLYLLINKALLALSGAQAAQYMGMSEMGKINPRLIPHLVKTCYLQFFGFLFTDMEQVVPGAMGVVNGLLLAFIVVAMGALAFFGKKRTRLQNACVALIFLALPLLLNSVYMMNAESTHMLMRYSMAFFYVLAGMLMELLPTLALPRPRAAARGASLAAAALVFLSGFSFTVYSNQLYFMLNTSYEGATEYASRVLYRLETAEGYDATEPVLFVGYVGTTDYGHLPDYFSHIRGSGISTHPYGVLVTDSHWKAFLRSYLGMPLLSPTDEQSALLRQSDTVKNMPRYPSDGCVQKLDGVWVVKLADE